MTISVPRTHLAARLPLRPVAIVAGLLLCAAVRVTPLAAQLRMPAEPELHEPFVAWDRGHYDVALEGYLRALGGPRGAALAEQIALLTGELYPVREVARDGRALRMGPD